MKLVVLCMLMAALAMGSLGKLQPTKTSYKILMLLPVSSRSQKIIFMTVAEGLANRGHKVVMLTNHPKSSTHPNITEIQHGLPHYTEESLDMFDVRITGFSDINTVVLPKMARDLYKVKEVQELYKRRMDFDIIVLNQYQNEAAYPFIHGLPYITVVTNGFATHISAFLGNVINFSYVPGKRFHLPLTSLFNRFLNFFLEIKKELHWRYWVIVPAIQKELQPQFPDLPPLLELEKNLSLSLINFHFSLDVSMPLLPSQVDIGAIHCRPARPLPKDLTSWITGAGPSGVIYFSLGSITRGNSMPVKYVRLFIEAFRRLPQRVLWKYEGQLEGASDNVMTRYWLPQQDVLGHDNVKLFISHGGLLSTQESIYHAKPFLALPITADQPKNAAFVKTSGIGGMLAWEEITVEAITSAINEIIDNPKYKENVMQMSRQLRDQLTTPLERTVFWIEYVIRHRGAPQLKSPAAQLSWVEFLMLDVLGVVLVATISILYIVYRVARVILAWWRFQGGNKFKTE